MEQSYRALSK
jgi:hypothetical protein